MTCVLAEMWSVLWGYSFTLQMDTADLHGIMITDNLWNYYKLLEVHRQY